ncbi:MAG TPA: GDP-mannose 4,6-dehydratase [Clostridia bacterium]|nr:GDP-mannose 4,6-dehydratase [Clostridia bacterium]
MKVLVTGGCGFIGSHVVDVLIENGHEVFVFDNLSSGSLENLDERAELFTGDITNRTELDAFFRMRKPDAVIHHAAQIDVQESMKNPAYDCSVNIQGTVDLLSLAIQYGVRRFIYASSAAVYGNPEYLGIDEEHPKIPESFYGYSKLVPETYIRMMAENAGMGYAVLRYANVYGPRQKARGEGGVVAIFTERMKSGRDCVIYGDGNQTRDFIYVRDIARANLMALDSDKNLTANVSTSVATPVNGLFDTMKAIYHYTKPAVHEAARKGDIEHSWLDNSRIRELLGWQPLYDLEEGIMEMQKGDD